MIDVGTGPTIVLVPGIQGRWEWMRPTIDALSTFARVVSFSLAGEPGASGSFDSGPGFDDFLGQLDAVLDRARLERAILCGVSYGGLIAVRFAARRPKRVTGLILVSTPSPRWRLDDRLRGYCRRPNASAPLFCLEAMSRFVREISATHDNWNERLRFAARHARTVVAAPMSPTRASRRALLADAEDFVPDCRRIHCPTLVVTGDPDVDRVVPTHQTMEYIELIEGARAAILERTGHLGTVTEPARFAAMVREFVDQCVDLTAEAGRHGRAAAGRHR